MKKLKVVLCFIVLATMLSIGITAADANLLDTWTTRTFTANENGLFGASYGNGTFMVTKAGKGALYTSTDGAVWRDSAIPSDYEYIDVEYGNGTFVVVGYDGAILSTSDHGENWIARSSSTVNTLRGIAYGDGTFMVVGDGNTVITSVNSGATWNDSVASIPSEIGSIYSVAYGNNKFVVIGSNGTACTADKGESWTVGIGETASLSEAAYGNGMFVAVGDATKIVTSDDGINWESATSSIPAVLLYSVTYGNNCFAAVGNNHTIITSSNGTDWTLRYSDPGKNYYNVTSGENTFVAVGNFDNVIQSEVLSGVVSGSVKSDSGKVLAGAAVELNLSGTRYATTSNASGKYTITDIPGGTGYIITVEKTGFRAYTADSVAVVPGEMTTVDVSMTARSIARRTETVISNISVSYEPGYVTAKLAVEANADLVGISVATVTEQQLKDVVNKALEEAIMAGNNVVPGVEVEITAPVGTTEIQTSLPEGAFSDLENSNITELKIATPLGSVTFDKRSLQTLSEGTDDGIKITIGKVDAETLSEAARQKIGNRPVYRFSVTNPDGDITISEFGGNVTVSVAYTPQLGEDTNAIVIYHINEKGVPEIVSNGVYDPATGTVIFTTNHFSVYALGYNKLSFSDVAENAWYNNAVEFIAAREITVGFGNGKYNPDSKLTRGDFLVLLMNAYDINPDANPGDNFTDAGNTYYTGYLAAAKRLNVSDGIGNNRFAPDSEITRQEMLTMLYNALKVIDMLPEGNTGNTISDFSDAGQIATWAADAMTMMVETGTVNGSNGMLSPTDTTTRAEIAQVLYNLMSK